MPKKKNQQPTPAVKSRRRPKGTDGSDNATLVPAPSQLAREPSNTGPQIPTTPFTNEQLLQVSQAVADIISRQSQCMPIEPLLPSMPVDEPSTGTEPEIFSSNYFAQTQSYDNDLGHMVPNRVKHKIVNGEYINLGLLVENSEGLDPNDDTKYFSMKEGSLTLVSKSKAKVITDIQFWTDAFLIYASIYASAHPENRAQLFKYIHTIRLGASRVKTLGWRNYDVQFRLKKEANPSLSFAVVDQELWLLYMYSTTTIQSSYSQALLLKCYDFNYKGQCSKSRCQYKHECISCSQNHPYIRHKTSSGTSLNFRSGDMQATWRPQQPKRSTQPSSTSRAPHAQSFRPH
ncbi:uncharacterized protein LOC125660061 [Ostrea edulis]|uniref:uncharacterized protein LOC125660061 n=1 Tax=Ostrea edulis TaxID=37623 RepID=UPI0024AED8BE|nr:uncharacterized protein LOC125660061 [Ostrea edulis]